MSLAHDLITALDPVSFSGKILGITPDLWQEKALRYEGKRLIFNCARGKQ